MTDLVCFSATGSKPIKPKVYNDGFDVFEDNFTELHTYTQRMAYSTMIYKDGKRSKANVEGYGSILIFDIDNDENKRAYTRDELIERVQGYKALWVTTSSHTKEYHRLRLIVPLDKRIPTDTSVELYEQMMIVAITALKLDIEKLDRQCLSTDRSFAPNIKKQYHGYLDGEVLPTQLLLDYATKALESKKVEIKPISPVSNKNSSMMPLQTMRAYIKEHHSFDLMKQLLEHKGLTVKRNGSVVIAGNKTQALSVDPKTGILADFSTGDFFDVVSVHVDHYKDMDIVTATKHYYSVLGGQ